jgi:hypothetical protein
VASPAAILPIEDSIMKIKKVDKKTTAPATEAEALRKDPLKNYPQDNTCYPVIQDDD